MLMTNNYFLKPIFCILLLATTQIAFGQNTSTPENLQGVKEIVVQLDSAVAAMPAWEPEDSLYETADRAHDTWLEFTRLIEAEKYELALDFYQDGKEGDFLVYLRHSTQRYMFFSQVLRPLMEEFKGEDYALEQYISNLQLEKAMEDFSIELQADGDGYIPEVYPFVIRDLGYGLVVTGKMEEAQKLFKDLIDGVYGLTGDALYANFIGTKYLAKLHILDGNNEWAVETWRNFKKFLEENKTDFDGEELNKALQLVQDELDGL